MNKLSKKLAKVTLRLLSERLTRPKNLNPHPLKVKRKRPIKSLRDRKQKRQLKARHKARAAKRRQLREKRAARKALNS